MSDYSPVLLAMLFVMVCYILAFHKGVLSLLASGAALAIGMVLLLAGFEYLPKLAKDYLDIGLTWQFSLGVSVVLALVTALVFRVVFALVFKKLFNPDGWLHRFVDGVPGGILSLGPSLVAVFIFFTCIRAAGTVQELNYVESLGREEVKKMGGQIPPYPHTAGWRNAIESVPFLAPLLDATDPFSRRSARNAAALVLSAKGAILNNHFLVKPSTAKLAGMPRWRELTYDPAVIKAIENFDRVGLVTAPSVQAAADDPAVNEDLSELLLRPVIEDFVASIVPLPGSELHIDVIPVGGTPPAQATPPVPPAPAPPASF